MIQKIKELLDLIIKTTYPDIKVFPYYLKIENKKLKTKNGHWQKKSGEPFATIAVFNLDRGTKEILKTNIHEIAHNVEYSIYGRTGPSKRFYLVYKNLLETAIKLGLLTFDDIKDVYDIQQLIAAHGPITAKCGSLKNLIGGKSIIKVNKSYTIKDLLKERGYTYNSLEQNWVKEIGDDLVKQEVEYLSTLTDTTNIEVAAIQDVQIKAMAYIIVDNCYNYKDMLKSYGYIYRGYGRTKGNQWVKKIYVEDKQQELNRLSDLKGITIDVKLINPKKVKHKSKARD